MGTPVGDIGTITVRYVCDACDNEWDVEYDSVSEIENQVEHTECPPEDECNTCGCTCEDCDCPNEECTTCGCGEEDEEDD